MRQITAGFGWRLHPLLQEHHIKKQTLQSAINALLNKELIDRDDDRFFLPDRTLELWVERL